MAGSCLLLWLCARSQEVGWCVTGWKERKNSYRKVVSLVCENFGRWVSWRLLGRPLWGIRREVSERKTEDVGSHRRIEVDDHVRTG